MSIIQLEKYNPTRDSLDEITDLLHAAYAPLAAMGFNYVAATQSAEVTEKRLNAGVSYVALMKERIVGVITYYSERMPGIDEPEIYTDKNVVHFGQFAVSPELQKTGIGERLLDLVEEKARQAGKTTVACDTAEGASKLIAFYTKRGYAPAGYHRWSHAIYRSIILKKLIASRESE